MRCCYQSLCEDVGKDPQCKQLARARVQTDCVLVAVLFVKKQEFLVKTRQPLGISVSIRLKVGWCKC
ncbi:hypothetical protein Hanom_Chr01g00003191 [Helianthus anomalus]